MKRRYWLILLGIAAFLLLIYVNPQNITSQFQPHSIMDYQNDYNIAVHYPITQDEQVNETIQQFIAQEVAAFRSQYTGYTAYSDEEKAMLHITYQCYSRFATHIKFQIETQDKTGSQNKTHMIHFSRIAVTRPATEGTPLEKPKKRKLDPNKPMVALTFDDGPSNHTGRILELLDQNNAKGTFFLLGIKAEGFPDVVKEMQAAGHEIGNHTYDHKQLTKLNKEQMDKQIANTQKIIKEITGEEPKLLRPTYGSFNGRVREENMPIIMWNVDTLDWKSKNADSVYRHVMKQISDGDIILFHDTFESTEKAIERLLPDLTAKGYQFVTISELFEAKGIQLDKGKAYYSLSRST